MSSDPRFAALVRGAGGSFVVQVLGTGLAFAAQVLLARLLGTTHYGVFVVATGWIALLAVPASAGHGTAALRFVASYVAARDFGRLRGYLRVALASGAVVSLALAAAMFAVSQLAGESLGEPLARALEIGALVLPLQTALVLLSAILLGLRSPVLSLLPSSLIQHPVMIACVVAAFATGIPATGRTAMVWTALASAAALALSIALLVRRLPREVQSASEITETSAWTRVALPLFWITALNLVLQRADLLIVGARLGSEAAGVYSAASRLALLISFGLTAVNAWAAPAFAEIHARGDADELQRVVRLAARVVTAFTIPVAVAIGLASTGLLGLFGEGFESGRRALAILCGGQVVNALLGPVGYLMTMTGNQGEAARILTVSALANVALCAVLAPRYGLEGAALGTACTQILWNVWMSLAVWRRLGVRATVL